MGIDEVRKKYIEFFKKAPRSHEEIEAAPLVLEGDPTTLFTSSGMQPLVPFLKGEEHSQGKRLVDSQPSIRLQDIDEVGDNRHTTYFEMLGNWSLGDYFKKEQLKWCWEFLTEELGLSKKKLWVTVFEGTKGVEKDTESYEVWKSLGVPEERIRYYGVGDNWWSRSGPPEKMPVGEIGGPDSEVFFEFASVEHDPEFGKECHPGCDCGRFLEIANSVFIQYEKLKDGSLKELSQRNVDFGGGLERLVAAVNNDPDVFKIDVFSKIISEIEKVSGKSYDSSKEEMRVIADHMRASAALIENGVVPSNKLQGYVLRRLIRRSAIKMRKLKGEVEEKDLSLNLKEEVKAVVEEEVGRFRKTLNRGLREIEKIEKINGKRAFDLYQTYGFPLEITEELFEEKGQKIDRKKFEKEFESHREKSRSATKGVFKGGLADGGEETKKLHTTTHLLHEALRLVLGEHVMQKGSNITAERARFDFSHGEKLSEEEIRKVQEMVNEQVGKDMKVESTTMSLEEAKEKGVLAFFGERYGERVKVYSIGDFSKEVCGGPHVENTSEIGRVTIYKEGSAGAGVRRIYARLAA